MEATHTALLDMPHIPLVARYCHLFPDMRNKVLLSIAQFCDNGYKAIFTRDTLIMEHEMDPSKTFEGQRDQITNMWSIDLNACNMEQQALVPNNNDIKYTSRQSNNVYDCTLKRDIVRYLHRAAGSPVPSTWCAAIDNGNFATWPGLSSHLVHKHLPKSIATAKGHMMKIRQHIRSTKPKDLPKTLHLHPHRVKWRRIPQWIPSNKTWWLCSVSKLAEDSLRTKQAVFQKIKQRKPMRNDRLRSR